jgi:hypothetical protein
MFTLRLFTLLAKMLFLPRLPFGLPDINEYLTGRHFYCKFVEQRMIFILCDIYCLRLMFQVTPSHSWSYYFDYRNKLYRTLCCIRGDSDSG